MRITILTGLVAVALGVAAGCTTPPPTAADYGQPGDNTLLLEIRERLASDPITQRYVIGVSAFRGYVTLSGAVPSDIRPRALGIARGTKGVRSVEDQMTVPAWGVPPTILR